MGSHGLVSPCCYEETGGTPVPRRGEYTGSMEVTVLLFGPAAMAVGRERVVVRVESGATCGEVLQAMGAGEARLGPFVTSGRLAVNHAFADAQRVVGEGDEVALIAMVSGG